MNKKMKKSKHIPEKLEEPSAIKRPSMFSPASFFDILSTPEISGLVESIHVKKPRVVAFYGFKGGAGRSTALGYAASILAKRGLYIVAVDLDLEAPGLATLFGHSSDSAPLGSLHLLSLAASQKSTFELGAKRFLLPIPDSIGSENGKVDLIPAGTLDDKYLAQLEELGVGMWHAFEPERLNPLQRVLEDISELEPDAIFLDCRTGFSSLSATALFHSADVIVTVLPLSDQIWPGLTVLLKALKKARQQRGGEPSLLLVPSLILPGKEGDARLNIFIKKMKDLADSILPPTQNPDDESLTESTVDILKEGVKRRDSIWSEGNIRLPISNGGDSELFRELTNWIGESIGDEIDESFPDIVDREKILKEIKLGHSAVFGERLTEKEMEETLIDSRDARAAVDRSVSLVIGAKGAGKTFLWRYLALPNRPVGLEGVPTDVDFIVALSPDPALTRDVPLLSASGFQLIERDSKLKLNGNHTAFWIWWCIQALAREKKDLINYLAQSKSIPAEYRSLVKRYLVDPSPNLLVQILKRKDSGPISELAFDLTDKFLSKDSRTVCLLFDGLDTGFQTSNPKEWPDRRNRFVTGLLQLLGAWRSRLKRIQFKVFLREDIWVDVQMQNKSHLTAISHVLHFEEKDLWKLVLKVVNESVTYQNLLERRKIDSDSDDVDALRKALVPLWGLHNEKGKKKAYSANYVIRRLADSQDRLFPRTILQMLIGAIEGQKKNLVEGQPDRVLRFSSLKEGIDLASDQRVTDLKTEYVELGPYLDAMSGCEPLLDESKFISHLRTKLSRSKSEKAPPVKKFEQEILPRLSEVGVLKIIPENGAEPARVEVARLYRNGLKMKTTKGLN